MIVNRAQLLPAYDSSAELEPDLPAVLSLGERTPATGDPPGPPAEMLAEEAARLHPLLEYPYTAAFGVTRGVPVNTQMIAFENGQLNRHSARRAVESAHPGAKAALRAQAACRRPGYTPRDRTFRSSTGK